MSLLYSFTIPLTIFIFCFLCRQTEETKLGQWLDSWPNGVYFGVFIFLLVMLVVPFIIPIFLGFVLMVWMLWKVAGVLSRNVDMVLRVMDSMTKEENND